MIEAKNKEAARLIKRYKIKEKRSTLTRAWSKDTYQDYLQSDWWKSRRKRAMKKALYACQICKETKDLQVHHNTYERLGDELDSDMIVVCRNCHEMIHGKTFTAEINY